MVPFFGLKYAPPAMAKTTPKGSYANAAPKDVAYGSIIVVSSVASTYGGCWGPAFTMSSHAALGVVRAGVATLKGSGVRINAISPGQIDIGVSLAGFDMRGLSAQLPPSDLQSDKVKKEVVGLERAGTAREVARVAGFLASGFSSYVTGANMVVDGGEQMLCVDLEAQMLIRCYRCVGHESTHGPDIEQGLWEWWEERWAVPSASFVPHQAKHVHNNTVLKHDHDICFTCPLCLL